MAKRARTTATSTSQPHDMSYAEFNTVLAEPLELDIVAALAPQLAARLHRLQPPRDHQQQQQQQQQQYVVKLLLCSGCCSEEAPLAPLLLEKRLGPWLRASLGQAGCSYEPQEADGEDELQRKAQLQELVQASLPSGEALAYVPDVPLSRRGASALVEVVDVSASRLSQEQGGGTALGAGGLLLLAPGSAEDNEVAWGRLQVGPLWCAGLPACWSTCRLCFLSSCRVCYINSKAAACSISHAPTPTPALPLSAIALLIRAPVHQLSPCAAAPQVVVESLGGDVVVPLLVLAMPSYCQDTEAQLQHLLVRGWPQQLAARLGPVRVLPLLPQPGAALAEALHFLAEHAPLQEQRPLHSCGVGQVRGNAMVVLHAQDVLHVKGCCCSSTGVLAMLWYGSDATSLLPAAMSSHACVAYAAHSSASADLLALPTPQRQC